MTTTTEPLARETLARFRTFVSLAKQGVSPVTCWYEALKMQDAVLEAACVSVLGK